VDTKQLIWRIKNKSEKPWYHSFMSAKNRCNNINNQDYKYYGGKGIKFLITLKDIAKIWFRDKAYLMKQPSIDRIDNDGNYELNNVQFIELSKNCRKDKIGKKLIDGKMRKVNQEKLMNNQIQLFLGDNREVLKTLEDNSVDSVVCDPPYEIGFMTKGWDNTGIAYDVNLWKEVLRVLKPGGHLLAFSSNRTYRRMVCSIEDSGFEIRDMINWIFATGFPKSLNIGKAIDKLQGNKREIIGKGTSGKPESHASSLNMSQVENNTFGGKFEVTKGSSEWEGWGTALKPAHEPIVLARKPLSEKTVALNVLKWGVGGINIDDCRIKHNEETKTTKRKNRSDDTTFNNKSCGFKSENLDLASANATGRFPANLIHDGSEEVVELFPNSNGSGNPRKLKRSAKPNQEGWGMNKNNPDEVELLGAGKGSASRFFYCAKCSSSERNEGLNEFEEKQVNDGRNKLPDNALQRGKSFRKNTHPTVKPITLMKYLITLVTPKNGIVLDPFAGSCSTGVACKILGKKFIGIELNKEYLDMGMARIKGCNNEKK